MTAQTCIHVAYLMARSHGDVKLILLPYYLPPICNYCHAIFSHEQETKFRVWERWALRVYPSSTVMKYQIIETCNSVVGHEVFC